MVFSSLPFLFRFLPILLILYFLPTGFKMFRPWLIAWKNSILFIGSLIFYAWGEPVYIVLMLFSTLVDYSHGMLVNHFKNSSSANGRKKAQLAVLSSVLINLFLLGFFKYSDFLIETINRITGLSLFSPNLPLPIGISFYTFQTMSYTIDVYRGDAKVQKNLIAFGTYVTLFPQLIAGPIVQYKTIADQLTDRKENWDSFSYGIHRFLIGLGKKVLLANTIGLLWDSVRAIPQAELTTLSAWIGIFAFGFQIYFDFSGYSDMAIGLGRMFGFHFLENFNYPYISKSITEFWRRWHISLGTWFREYVYIPLGGNRKGLPLQIRNIIIVWLLTGIWHGADWNFLFWGAYFALLLILEKGFLLRFLSRIPSFFQHCYAVCAIAVGWVIFSFEDMEKGFYYLSAMFGFSDAGFLNRESLYFLTNYGVLFFLLLFGSTPFFARFLPKLLKRIPSGIGMLLEVTAYVLIFLLCTAYLVDATYNPFLYFRF